MVVGNFVPHRQGFSRFLPNVDSLSAVSGIQFGQPFIIDRLAGRSWPSWASVGKGVNCWVGVVADESEASIEHHLLDAEWGWPDVDAHFLADAKQALQTLPGQRDRQSRVDEAFPTVDVVQCHPEHRHALLSPVSGEARHTT